MSKDELFVELYNAEDVAIITEYLNRKFKHEVRRSRKIADNKEHLRKLAEKRGVAYATNSKA